MLEERLPCFRLLGRHRGHIEQPAQFRWAALGEAPFATMLSGVIGPGIQAGKRDEGIRTLQGCALEGVNQGGADDLADAVDRAQVSDMLLAVGACLDQCFDSLVDARNDPIEASSEHLEIGGKSVQTFERHAECLTQRTELGATFGQTSHLALEPVSGKSQNLAFF